MERARLDDWPLGPDCEPKGKFHIRSNDGLVAREIVMIELGHSVTQFAHSESRDRWDTVSILWTIIIGFVAGVIAKLVHPGDKYEPSGFILTTVLGIVGAFVATYLGQAVGWYKAGESAGFIGAIVGAIIILVVWGVIAPRIQKT